MLKKIVIIFVLLILYTYIVAIGAIPNSVIIFEGEKINLSTIFGLNLDENEDYRAILTSSNVGNTINEVGTAKVNVNLFNLFPVKEVDVNVIEKTTVIPVGTIAGVKLYTSGVLVVGMTEIKGIDNNKYKPYENSGIEEGDMIISIGQKTITCTADLIETVNNSKGEELEIEYVRDGKTLECNMKPTETAENEYKLGLWVRDSAAGVGTVTFYEPSTKTFGALGHGITDIDTEQLINISKGEFITTKVLNIIKGEKGSPGKIQGTVENQKEIGTIYKNTGFGIYGQVENEASLNIDYSKQMEVALRDEIKTGKATILCSLDNNEVKEYEIEIEKIYTNNNYDNKSMLIKVTDKGLLQKTGGIIQGMSGSPIIQNGKFCGAVTHVLVNNPTEGYAVFGDLMIKQSREVN